MNRQQKKELRQRQTSRQLMGIRQLTDHGAKTAGGELVFFMIKPDNLSVLSGEGIRSRVKNLTDLLCGTQEVRLLALDSRESFQRNKDWYRQRLETEELPAIRELLRQDVERIGAVRNIVRAAAHAAAVAVREEVGQIPLRACAIVEMEQVAVLVNLHLIGGVIR